MLVFPQAPSPITTNFRRIDPAAECEIGLIGDLGLLCPPIGDLPSPASSGTFNLSGIYFGVVFQPASTGLPVLINADRKWINKTNVPSPN